MSEQDVRTFRGSALEDVLPKIREELGEDAEVVARRETLEGGVGGFFAKKVVEVDARRPGPGPGSSRLDVRDEDLEEEPSFAATLDDVLARPAGQDDLAQLFRAGMETPADQTSGAGLEGPVEEQGTPALEGPAAAAGGLQPPAEDLPPAPEEPPAAVAPPVPEEVPSSRLADEPGSAPASPLGTEELDEPAAAAPAPDDVSDLLREALGGGAAPEDVEEAEEVPEVEVVEVEPVPEAAPEPAEVPVPEEPPVTEVDPEPLEAPEPAAEAPVPAPEAVAAGEPGLSSEPDHVAHLVARGFSAEFAAALVADAQVHLAPFTSGMEEGELARRALATRIPVFAPRRRGHEGVLAVVGAGGAGKTQAVVRLAQAYAERSVLPVAVVALAPHDGGAELERLLGGRVEVAVGADAEAAAAHLDRLRAGALVLLDTNGVPPRDADALRDLAADLTRLRPDEVHFALPAPTGPGAARELATAARTLGAHALMVTHADSTSQLGTVVELAIESGLPLSYVSHGPVQPAAAHELAAALVG